MGCSVKSSLSDHSKPCSFAVLIHYKKIHVATAMLTLSNPPLADTKNKGGLPDILDLS